MNKPITVESHNSAVSASLALESCWLGNTVYPAVPVLRVHHRRGAVIQSARLALQPLHGQPLRYGFAVVSVKRTRPATRLGPGRQVVVRLQEQSAEKRELVITLRLSEISAFWSLRQPRCRSCSGVDLSAVQWSDGTVFYTPPDGSPAVAHSPAAILAAYWHHAAEHHLIMLERPGRLAEMKFGVRTECAPLPVEQGADGCRFLYTRLPFSREAPAVVYGAEIRESFKSAYDCLLAHFSSSDDDFWVIRGLPAEFAVAARRIGSRWLVCGITAAGRTLTVRFEDLWMRLPAELRAVHWDLTLIRDAVNQEPGATVRESFTALAPDIRVALDLKKNGGFLMEFNPHGGSDE